jgi:hypothetical protein
MKKAILSFIIIFPLLSACGRFGEDAEVQEDTVTPEMIAMEDGTVMSVSCVKKYASVIMSQGRGAADACIMGNAKRSVDKEGRGFGSSYPSWWSSYYIYPPSYYGGNYGNLCTYLGFGNYGGYGSGYGYGSYGYGGYGSGYNCYSEFLGYDTRSVGYYDDACDRCLTKANPSRCYNKCLYRNGWYW